MARQKSSRRQARALNTLQDKGFGLIALGLAFLIIPKLMGSSPGIKALAAGLGTVSWFAMAIGAVLLLLHHLAKTRNAQVITQAQQTPVSSQAVNKEKPRPINAQAVSQRLEPGFECQTAPKAETSWNTAVFAAIEWRRFEAVCEKLFAQAGFETKSQSHGADGGVDIWLHSRNAPTPVIVQCKHWQGQAVGVKEMREFFGVMASHKLTRGTYATTSVYTPDAQQFAKANGINALDGKGLLALIAKRTPEQQQELLDVAYEGEYWRPTCASCGIKMVERKPAKGGAKFWGCSHYPKCKSRLPMLAALR